jgi:broad specificity phosphatase PhoE
MAEQNKLPKVVVHLIRHGERPTESVSAGQLSPKGREQGVQKGRTIGKELNRNKKKKIVKFYTSDVDRNRDFMNLIAGSLGNEANRADVKVEQLSPRIRNKFKYSTIRDQGEFDRRYGNMNLDTFEKLWFAGRVPKKVCETPREVLERVQRWTEDMASHISHKYKGNDVEIHLVIVTHGDLIGALRQHITGKIIKTTQERAQFAERIKISMRGRKGSYESRGTRKKFVRKSIPVKRTTQQRK